MRIQRTLRLVIAATPLLWFAGCGEPDTGGATATETPGSETSTEESDLGESTESTDTAETTEEPELTAVSTASTEGLTPIPLANGLAEISAENSRIVFVGTHADPNKPDPRTGGFAKFEGKASVKDGKLVGLMVKIDIESVFTFNDKLTGHLKNADFFEVNEFPTAQFESMLVKDGVVMGKLTMHGVTNEVSFPAAIKVTDAGLVMAAEFQIDRTEFGMTYGEGKILPTVDMTLALGAKTDKDAILAGK